MQTVDFSKTRITGGFWKEKQDMLRETTVHAVYNRFKETGRFDAFRCDWQPGMLNQPHVFWDSDVAKWIEGVSYLTKIKQEPQLEKIVDDVVDLIVQNQTEEGYYNSHFLTADQDQVFCHRDLHELYTAGHLIEAAVAYYEATGKRKFLDAMCRFADYIEKRFKIDQDTPMRTPGHQEIELALVKLYRCTGEKRYLDLSKFFLDERATNETPEDVRTNCYANQSYAPVRDQVEAYGHAVRAVYMYSGMADVAFESGTESFRNACEKIFDNIITKKMYITGGVGSTRCNEAFSENYDLSNLLSYCETCADIGLVFFATRMLKFEADSRYSDTIERIIYNAFMSSTSLDGKAFFYENPQEIIPYLHTREAKYGRSVTWSAMERSEVFGCSCCPPNIVRFIPSIANLLYTTDDNTVYVHQFMESESEFEVAGQKIKIKQKTNYPEDGKIKITVDGADIRLAVRIPWWAIAEYPGETKKGYAYFDVKSGETKEFNFRMEAKLIEARPELVFDCGRYAVMRGPVVYCMEGVDNIENLRDVRLAADKKGKVKFKEERNKELSVPTLTAKAFRRRIEDDRPLYSEAHDSLMPIKATFIPYYAIANRGVTSMQIWTMIEKKSSFI